MISDYMQTSDNKSIVTNTNKNKPKLDNSFRSLENMATLQSVKLMMQRLWYSVFSKIFQSYL